jgi:hypothetical protein
MMKKPSHHRPGRLNLLVGRFLSKDNKLHGIIRRALTLTANVSIISGDGQEEAQMNSHHNSSLKCSTISSGLA